MKKNDIWIKKPLGDEEARREAADAEIAKFIETEDPSDGHLALERIAIYSLYNLAPLESDIGEILRGYNLCKTGYINRSVQVTDENLRPIYEPAIYPSLDEALGLPKRNNRKTKAEVKKAALSENVYRRLQDLHKNDHPISEITFELIGENLGISGSLARDYYLDLLKAGFPSIGGRKNPISTGLKKNKRS